MKYGLVPSITIFIFLVAFCALKLVFDIRVVALHFKFTFTILTVYSIFTIPSSYSFVLGIYGILYVYNGRFLIIYSVVRIRQRVIQIPAFIVLIVEECDARVVVMGETMRLETRIEVCSITENQQGLSWLNRFLSLSILIDSNRLSTY